MRPWVNQYPTRPVKVSHQHYKIYKPFGVLSQLSSGEDRQLRNKRFLSALYPFPKGMMPIGRLDEKSEGLLLMTTDGKRSDTINSTGIEKEYYAQLDGEITGEAMEQLRGGVVIGVFGTKHSSKPCVVDVLNSAPALPQAHPSLRIGRHRPTSWITITLREGKFRQVRKMTAAVGFPTLRLIRIRIGDVHLDQMQPGAVTPIVLEDFFI